jgi:hypothetical protein
MDVVQAMEQSSAPGRVHVSPEFAEVLRGCSGAAEFVLEEQPDGTALLSAAPVVAHMVPADHGILSTESMSRTPSMSLRPNAR